MKRFFLISFFIFITLSLFTQSDTILCDSCRQNLGEIKKIDISKIDTTNETYLQERARLFVSSVFGESRKLKNADSIINKFDENPSFGIYKENYFIVGTEMLKIPTQYNSDAKFQVSIRQRLTNSTLPFKTYLYLTYTQKAFWGVFQNSFPFLDLNYNPSIGLGKALVYNNRLLGSFSLQFEHESNGKGGTDSRSWNKVTANAGFLLDDNWKINAKIWLPIVDGQNNKDIVRYAGWTSIAFDYFTSDKKYGASCTLVKRGGLNLNTNIILNFSTRLFNDDNQYFFAEYYNGFGESMLDYNQYRQRLRIGIVFRPNFFHPY